MLKYLPIPFPRYSIFAGTNTFNEFLLAIKLWIRCKHQEQSIIEQYEQKFAEETQTKKAISFASGRMSLFSILEALDLKEGDEVILPAFTCVVVPNALLYKGVVPVYVDIEDKDFNINPDLIHPKITKKTKAIYAQHTFGNICAIDKIKELAKEHKLYIIEDSAHALGNDHNGTKVGGLGDVSFFSTDHSKVINTGFGGMVCTNNKELATKLSSIQQRTPFLTKNENQKILKVFICEYILYMPYFYWFGRFLINLLGRIKFFSVFPDELTINLSELKNYPSRLSSSVAQIGYQQLMKLPKNIEHRIQIAKKLGEEFRTFQEKKNSTYLRFSFLVKDRNKFVKAHQLSYDLGIWFDSIFQGRNDRFEEVHYIEGSCPVAEKCVEHIVNYPTHPRINVRHVIKSFRKFLKNNPNQIVKDTNEL